MKLDYLKEKKELVSVVLLGVSVVLVASILIKVWSFFDASAKAGEIVKKAVAQNNMDAGDTQDSFAKSKELADGLKKNNLFVPPLPKQHPVKEVPAIFGDEVLINNKWYKVGDMVGDAKILAIEATKVQIEWDGKVKSFLPIDAKIYEPPKSSKSPSKTAAKTGKAESVTSGERRPMPGRDGRRGPGGFGGRPGMPGPGGDPRAEMRERFMNMSEAERDKFRINMREKMEKIRQMPEAQRQKAISQMREYFGGGGMPGGGPGGRSRGGPRGGPGGRSRGER